MIIYIVGWLLLCVGGLYFLYQSLSTLSAFFMEGLFDGFIVFFVLVFMVIPTLIPALIGLLMVFVSKRSLERERLRIARRLALILSVAAVLVVLFIMFVWPYILFRLMGDIYL